MLYVLHKDGVLYRGKRGTGWRSVKKTYVFVTKGAAKAALKTLSHVKGLEIVKYVPTLDLPDYKMVED